jgi:hypothetical protein
MDVAGGAGVARAETWGRPPAAGPWGPRGPRRRTGAPPRQVPRTAGLISTLRWGLLADPVGVDVGAAFGQRHHPRRPRSILRSTSVPRPRARVRRSRRDSDCDSDRTRARRRRWLGESSVGGQVPWRLSTPSCRPGGPSRRYRRRGVATRSGPAASQRRRSCGAHRRVEERGVPRDRHRIRQAFAFQVAAQSGVRAELLVGGLVGAVPAAGGPGCRFGFRHIAGIAVRLRAGGRCSCSRWSSHWGRSWPDPRRPPPVSVAGR